MSIRLFYSKPAKIMLYLAIPVILVTQFARFNSLNIITQALAYIVIAYNAECLVGGGCDLWAWISVALPILYSLLFIFFGKVSLPSPQITNLMPIQQVINDDKNIAIVNPNTTMTGIEPQSGSTQPTPTTGDIIEALSF